MDQLSDWQAGQLNECATEQRPSLYQSPVLPPPPLDDHLHSSSKGLCETNSTVNITITLRLLTSDHSDGRRMKREELVAQRSVGLIFKSLLLHSDCFIARYWKSSRDTTEAPLVGIHTYCGIECSCRRSVKTKHIV